MRSAIRALLSVTALSACNFLSDSPPRQCGSFAGRASGATADSIVGCAYFANDPISGDFGLVLTNGGPQGATKIKLFSESTPGSPGVLSAGSAFSGVIFLGSRSFSITAGTITIRTVTRSGNKSVAVSRLAGRLDVTGTEVGGSAQMTVTGEFEAMCVASPEFTENDPGVEGGVCGGGAIALKLTPRPKDRA